MRDAWPGSILDGSAVLGAHSGEGNGDADALVLDADILELDDSKTSATKYIKCGQPVRCGQALRSNRRLLERVHVGENADPPIEGCCCAGTA